MKLSRNVVWNTAGACLPLLVGVLAIPRIIERLGVTRFGLLSVIWMMIGYFSIFDLGLGRSLTKLVADRIGENRLQEIPALLATTLVTVAAGGFLMGIPLALCGGWIARDVLHLSPETAAQVAVAIRWLAAGLPFVLVSSSLYGVLEAFQRFSLTNAVRIPTGVLMYLTPLAVVVFTRDLGAVTAGLVVLRVVSTLVLALLSIRTVPVLRDGKLAFRRSLIRPLLSYGGWLTVTNVVGPVMVYFDRFLIAIVLGSAAVAFYTVPYDVLSRLLIFPAAIQGVLFPAFATLQAQRSPRIASIFNRSSQSTLLLLAPALLGTLLLAHQGLDVWVGPLFAERSATVAKILMLGVLLNGLAVTPFGLLQGVGQAKRTAMLHLAELPPYLVLLWLLVHWKGIEGAALVWTGRVAVDAVALYVMAIALDRGLIRTALRDLIATAAVCAMAIAIDFVFSSLGARLAAVSVFALACALVLARALHRSVFPLSWPSLRGSG